MFEDIHTERLRLCAMTDEPRQADETGDYAALGEALGCTVTPQWPPEHWEPHVFAFLKEQFAAHPDHVGWNRYIVLRGAPDVLAGSCNAFAVSELEAEIGYAVLPAFEGRGFATESVRALLEFLRMNTPVRSVRAHTFPHLTHSLRVMEKCGFVADGAGEEAGTVRYRLQLRPSP